MNINEQQKRSWLKNQYPHSRSWAERVDRMFDQQVQAVYLRMRGEEEKVKETPGVSPDQLKLF